MAEVALLFELSMASTTLLISTPFLQAIFMFWRFISIFDSKHVYYSKALIWKYLFAIETPIWVHFL